jgi:NAD(P) transhydrogenase subunit beta
MLFGDAKKNVDAILTQLRAKDEATSGDKVLVSA